MRVHQSGTPFLDRSGDRLRAWMGIEDSVFYDRSRVSILPTSFCFPGYDAKGSDLPPPRICAETWHGRVAQHIGPVPLTLLIGGYAQKLHKGVSSSVTDTVRNWRNHAPETFMLPHPSWRNNAWLRKNPWFETELLPALQEKVRSVLSDT